MKLNKTPKLIMLIAIFLVFTTTYAYAQQCEEGTHSELFAGSRPSANVYNQGNGAWPDSGLETDETRIWSLGYYSVNNYLYAGTADQNGYIYEYDGCEWKFVYDTKEKDVKAFEEYNGKIYASTGERGRVFVNDGNGWKPAFDPAIKHDGEDRFGYSLKTYKGKLYYGTGWRGGTIYVYDGSTWKVSGNGNLKGTDYFEVYSLEVYDGKLYAGTGKTGQVYVLNNDGGNWQYQATLPKTQLVWSLKSYNGNLYAGTNPNGIVYKFNGVNWVESFDSPASSIMSLESHEGVLYAATTYGATIYKYSPGNGWNSEESLYPEGTIYSLESGCIANCEAPTGCIQGVKREGDNTPSDKEWTIKVRKYDPNAVAPFDWIQTKVTNANGAYKFNNLEPGRYVVKEVMKNGWEVFPEFKVQYNNVVVVAGETCTPRPFKNQRIPYCGDSICNDGNDATCEPDGAVDFICSNEQKVAEMADGICRPQGHQYECTYCGDGDVQEDEETCDDGNNVNGDGCDEFCEVELPYCGDSICNDGNDATCEPDGAVDFICSNNQKVGEMEDGVCRTSGQYECTYCGDGVKQPVEECDDGNRENGDGCNEFCVVEDGCLIGHKWDIDENPLDGWEIIAYQVDGDNEFSTTTSDSGFFGFDDLTPGLWLVCEEMQDGWEVVPGYQECYYVTVEPGDLCAAQDFYNVQIPPVGCVDGIKRDDNHVGLPGWEVHAKKVGQPDSSSVSTVSGNGGYFSFNGLELGMYEFWEVMQSGWEPVTLARFQAEVFEGEVCTPIAFKNRELPQDGCLSGYKRDNVQVGLPGWSITAQLVGSDAIYIEDTDGTGYYEFSEMEPGLYEVCEEMQNGWEVAPGYQECYYVTVEASEEVCAEQSFVNKQVPQTGCLEGFKKDTVDVGLPGWEIRAYKNDVVHAPLITQTDGTGYYRFDDMLTGSWTVLEIMQSGWDVAPGHQIEYVVEILPGEECTAQTFTNVQVPTCIDECNLGDTMCQENDLLVCGDFDDDECYEWSFAEDCYYHEHLGSFNVCEFEDSYTYEEVEEGFCNDLPGYNDYCDSHNYDEEIEVEDCGVTECVDGMYCENKNVYSESSCTLRGCEEQTGLCYEEQSSSSTLVEDCGENSDDEYCDGQNIVRTHETRDCVEEGDAAFCVAASSIAIVEECGPDICTEYTVMDPFTKEYVYDEEACNVGELVCVFDPGQKDDYCVNTQVLNQSYCAGNDHAYLEFDCSSLPSCVEFTYETCETCWDPYDYSNCKGEYCNKTGFNYVENSCGDGACQSEEMSMVDTDKDMIDDRCDDCIDVDRDGICDDVDTCVGVYNPTNVDTDNDGQGNACDDDKDDDGYNSDIDCDDWDPEVNPGAKEIKNNGRDDDCSAETLDKGTYAPRQALWVDVTYDEELIEPGEDLTVVVKSQNNHIKTLKNVKYTVSIPGYTRKQSKLVQKFDSGDTETKVFKIEMPSELSGFEYLRISVSNDEYKRVIYRELRLPE
jgi:cysteine-rich repeat protein